MSKAYYEVVIIRPKMRSAYLNYYKKGITANPDGSAINAGDLAFTEMVEAKNKRDAEEKMEKKFPDCSVDVQPTAKCG